MGEVYRARDTRLGRSAAIKSLPATFAYDAERVARLKREAQLLASLNHPHIAGIYGLEESNGLQYLALEFVDGETLADRISRGPLPHSEAMRIAQEVADALEAAHDKGIIHRDLKPANIALTSEGQVKVLDFGLARYEAGESGSAVDLTHSPTMAYAGTQAGVILGTAAYMSPEQAKGRSVDKRSDVWAFGCVLFEMLTGLKAFEGEDVSDTLASILRSDPDWKAIPPDVPQTTTALIKRCLDRDRRARIPDFSVVRFFMAEPATAAAAVEPSAAAPPRSRWQVVVPWSMTAALALTLAALAVRLAPWRASAPPAPPVRLSADVGASTTLAIGAGPSSVLSRDGSVLAFTASPAATDAPRIYVRRLEQLTGTMLTGTEGASSPFFSPDGEWIGFFAAGKLKKVAVSGGAVVTLSDARNPRGGWWADDHTIVFQPDNSPPATLKRVPDAGGAPSDLLSLADEEAMQRWPQILPGGAAVLYTALGATSSSWEEAQIVVRALPGGSPKVLQKGGYFGRYAPSGHILYLHEGTLFAMPFDPERLEVTGSSVPAIEGLLGSSNNGSAQFTMSDTGRVAYISGAAATNQAPIMWLDQTGKTTPLRETVSDWSSPAFSPDGTKLAIDISDRTQTDIWVYDWARDTLSRLTFDKADEVRPSWSPDGRRIAFASKRGDDKGQNLYWQRADGTGEAQRLTDGPNLKYGASFHPSGKFIAYTEQRPATSSDVMILPIEGDEANGYRPGTPTVFLGAPYIEGSPMFSPDGRWIAYISNESGRNEIYVRPFPGPGGKWQISNGPADDPTWSRTKPELLFLSANSQRMMRSPYRVTGESFQAEKPSVWSEAVLAARPRTPSRDLDLHPDGLRIVMSPGQTDVGARFDKVVMIFNFLDELKRLTKSN
jgi:serine/threonine-protein kinase